jgi:ribonuclease Z
MSASNDFRVTLLGTGTPIPRPDRFGPSTLVEAGSQKLLVDAGRGATIRLTQLGIPIGSIDALLLTHYHSDHTSGVPDIWLTGWLESHFGTRKTPFRVIGPTGAATLMRGLQQAYAQDIKMRIADEKLPLSGIDVQVSEYDRDGVVYDVDGLKVTAFEVDHGDEIKPSYGYRIDYDGRAAVLSSDTRFNENIIKQADGVDLLVHEVAAASPELMKRAYIQRIIAHHTVPQAAGIVFSRTRPKLAVYTHLVYLGNDSKKETIAPIDLDMLEAQTRETYDGPLVLGEDLMIFHLGETVRVSRWPR